MPIFFEQEGLERMLSENYVKDKKQFKRLEVNSKTRQKYIELCIDFTEKGDVPQLRVWKTENSLILVMRRSALM